MPEQLETDLTRVLAEAGSYADAPVDLLARVERRAGVRRRRQVIVAVTVLVTVAVVAPQFLPRAAPTTTADPLTTPAPPATPAPPVRYGPLPLPTSTADIPAADVVWPKAVVHIPEVLGTKGGTYAPVAQLDADHALVTRSDSFEHAVELYSYGVRDHKLTKLADLIGPPPQRDVLGSDATNPSEYFVQDFATNRTEIFWWATSNTNGGGPAGTEVWAVPRTGGTPRLVGTVSGTGFGGSDLSDMQAGDDALYWSAGIGGVYRMPVSGGPAVQLTGLEQFRMVAFPWATRLDLSALRVTPSNVSERPNTVSERPSTATLLRNVVTGEEIPIHAPGDAQSLWCLPTFCVGEADQPFAMRPDGSHRTLLSGISYSWNEVVDGRYALGRLGNAAYIVDTRTGTVGRLANGGAGGDASGFFWTEPGGTGMFLTAATG